MTLPTHTDSHTTPYPQPLISHQIEREYRFVTETDKESKFLLHIQDRMKRSLLVIQERKDALNEASLVSHTPLATLTLLAHPFNM